MSTPLDNAWSKNVSIYEVRYLIGVNHTRWNTGLGLARPSLRSEAGDAGLIEKSSSYIPAS